MFKLTIDVREKKAIHILKNLSILHDFDKNNITLEIKPLDIGDFIFSVETKNNSKELIIFERKSIPDLISSITDGRYNEQSLRLDQYNTIHNHNITYVIEGNINNDSYYTFNKRIHKKTVWSSIVSILYFKGFSVMKTSDIDETCMYIVCTVLKVVQNMKKKKNMFYGVEYCIESKDETNTGSSMENIICPIEFKHGFNESNIDVIEHNTTNKSYCDVIKKVKKENITKENIGEIILSQIPGISSNIAKQIMNSYGSLFDLLMKLKEDKSILNNFTIETHGGKKRKISYKAIESIKNYLLYSKDKETTISIQT